MKKTISYQFDWVEQSENKKIYLSQLWVPTFEQNYTGSGGYPYLILLPQSVMYSLNHIASHYIHLFSKDRSAQ